MSNVGKAGMIRPAVAGGQAPSSARLMVTDQGDTLRLESSLHRIQQISMTGGLLEPGNPVLQDRLAGRNALAVVSPSVYRLYGRQISAYLAAQPGTGNVDLMVLHRSESSKSLDSVVEVCERATAAGLRRMSPIVAIGGGVCCDICGLAAALHHRGVPHIKIPTTLIGLVDAGIGIKNAVNHGGRKSLLGSFHPPEHSLIDPGFLASLPRRELANGLAEIIKMAVIDDPVLFSLLARDTPELLRSGFRTPAQGAAQIIRRSVTGMLSELACNPFERDDFRRKVDFGHTFSPHIEVASRHSVRHGEAVAMDIALSAEIATALGLLGGEERDRILALIQTAGLSLTWPPLSPEALWASLAGIVEHRDGNLHLVVPQSIGTCEYLGLDHLSPQLLRACAGRLRQRDQADLRYVTVPGQEAP